MNEGWRRGRRWLQNYVTLLTATELDNLDMVHTIHFMVCALYHNYIFNKKDKEQSQVTSGVFKEH